MTSVNSLMEIVERNNYVVLDTETTGLERPAEICDICIINSGGTTILNTLVSPRGEISSSASRVHGITKLHTANAPDWTSVRRDLLRMIEGRDVIVYNAVFDRKMMHWSDEIWSLPHTEYKAIGSWWCLMEAFAEYYGEWNDYRQSYRWQKLSTACNHLGIVQMHSHRAEADAHNAFLVMHEMYVRLVDRAMADKEKAEDLREQNALAAYEPPYDDSGDDDE